MHGGGQLLGGTAFATLNPAWRTVVPISLVVLRVPPCPPCLRGEQLQLSGVNESSLENEPYGESPR